jgi:hypothetical protein
MNRTKKLTFVILSLMMVFSVSAYQMGGPLPVEHDWTINGYGIQAFAGKTYLLIGLHCFPIPAPFHIVLIGVGVISTVCVVSFALAFSSRRTRSWDDGGLVV